MRFIQKFSAHLLCLLALFSAAAFAQSNYPNKPINFIVPYGAGGSADSRSRQIAQKMSVILKQPIVIDNKPGAGGNIGTEAIVRAAPDGYTIGMGNFAPMSVNKTLFGNLRYDPEADLTPIILIEKGPLVLVVNPNSPFKTVQDIVAAAKAKPGVLTFSSGGIGGSHQLSAELFEQNAGIQMIHVPYKSGSAALTDLMGGNVDLMFDQMYSAVPSIKASPAQCSKLCRAWLSKSRSSQLARFNRT
jgi:tripartite-type tricarboxylate transporter receptor subunit TctC